jgi:hypothetical protein
MHSFSSKEGKGEALRHEDVWGSGYIDTRFLDLVTSWRWMVNFTPWPLYPLGKSLSGRCFPGALVAPDLRKILKWSFKKWGVRCSCGSDWGTVSCAHVSYETQRVSWLEQWVSADEEGLWFIYTFVLVYFVAHDVKEKHFASKGSVFVDS